ncbi:MAG: response regulator [Sorangiineae bacterium]|nr:response regulator [Polyangiaceae bacterium]MEB2321977.1 response regulator [Sorangiineae bacterium]
MSYSVLIVDPVVAVSHALGQHLERRGHFVEVAARAAEAVRIRRRFDCAVLNTALADGSGLELAGRLLAENRAASVVFYGAETDIELRVRASNLGSFVHRSEGIHHLSRVIDDAVEDTQARAASASRSEPATGYDDFKSGARRKR